MAAKTALSALLDTVKKPTQLISVIEQQLLKEEQSKPKYLPLGYHPSQLDTGACARALVYERLGVPVDDLIVPQTRRIFDNGTAVGTRLQAVMARAGLLGVGEIETPLHYVPRGLSSTNRKLATYLKKEVVPRTGAYELRGHADGFSLKRETVYEIKSANTRTFDGLVAPMPRHVVQASLYAWAFQATKVIFLYENKNNQELKEFVIEPDAAAVETVLKISQLAAASLQESRLPLQHVECTSSKTMKAKRCPMVGVCFRKHTFEELDRRHEKEARDYH